MWQISCHTVQRGLPCCYDNRDGIAYQTENNPDDGLNIPAICPQYTTETEGGIWDLFLQVEFVLQKHFGY